MAHAPTTVIARLLGFCVAAALTIASSTAWAWSSEGHQIVGAIADLDGMLTPHARKHVSDIIGMPLSEAALWPDCAKSVNISHGKAVFNPKDPYLPGACEVHLTIDPGLVSEMEAYVLRNNDVCGLRPGEEICHKQYHYTDVAIQHDSYATGLVGTSDHDIVAVLGAAIRVLQGKAVTAPISIANKREALFLIAHLVGDIHQPLHVGAVYLDAGGKRINPDCGTSSHCPPYDPRTATHGGNSITDGSAKLHSEWDAVAMKVAAVNTPKLQDEVLNVAKPSGNVALWPAAWATDTALAAHDAFSGIAFGVAHSGHWPASFSDRKKYLADKAKLQHTQLVKAGARLTALLNAIWP